MFYLRRIKKEDQLLTDFALGNSYTYVSKDLNRSEFDRISDLLIELGEMSINDLDSKTNIVGYLTYSTEILKLYDNSKYYIMTENGKTFNSL